MTDIISHTYSYPLRVTPTLYYAFAFQTDPVAQAMEESDIPGTIPAPRAPLHGDSEAQSADQDIGEDEALAQGMMREVQEQANRDRKLEEERKKAEDKKKAEDRKRELEALQGEEEGGC